MNSRNIRATFAAGTSLWVALGVACGSEDANPSDPGADSAASASGGASGTGNDGGGASGSSGASGARGEGGASGASGSSSGGVVAPVVSAADIHLTDVEINQGSGGALVAAGQVVASAERVPLVAGRPTLILALWELAPSFQGRELRGVLTVHHGDQTWSVDDKRQVAGASNWTDNYFRWVVPADQLTPDAALSLDVSEADSNAQPASASARVPAQGTIALEVPADPMTLKMVLVPIHTCKAYGREWNASVEADYKAYMMSVYPVASMELVVHEPLTTFAQTCDAGTIEDSVMTELENLRASENRGPEWYYQGMLSVENTPFDYSGYAWLNGPERDANRVGWMEWWDNNPGPISSHELGHNHGFSHDDAQDRPTWGWGPYEGPYPFGNVPDRLGDMKPPEGQNSANDVGYHDYMTYDYPFWVSDKQYRRAYERIKVLSAFDGQGPGREALELRTRRSLLGWVNRRGEIASWTVVRGVGERTSHGGEVTATLADGTSTTGFIVNGDDETHGYGIRIALPENTRAEQLEGARLRLDGKEQSVHVGRISGLQRLSND